MGVCPPSRLVRYSGEDGGEIPAYVQRDSTICVCCSALCRIGSAPTMSSRGILSEPARFNEPKPYHLQVSDDNWAALKLRVDPLARRLLDPHRAYLGAAFLCLLMTAVFSAIRPGWSYSKFRSYYGDDDYTVVHHKDDDYFDDFYMIDDDFTLYHVSNANGDDAEYEDAADIDDDVVLAELRYFNAEAEHDLKMWRIGFATTLSLLIVSTVALAVSMESRNAKYDNHILEVCDEMRSRFLAEGYDLGYRTRSQLSGPILSHFKPERVIVFWKVPAKPPSTVPGVPSPPLLLVQSSSSTPLGRDLSVHSPIGFPPSLHSIPPSVSRKAPSSASGSSTSSYTPPPQTSQNTTLVSSAHEYPDAPAMVTASREPQEWTTLSVRVPLGASPGQVINMNTPSGVPVAITIPSGARVGQIITVQVPATSPPSLTTDQPEFQPPQPPINPRRLRTARAQELINMARSPSQAERQHYVDRRIQREQPHQASSPGISNIGNDDTV